MKYEIVCFDILNSFSLGILGSWVAIMADLKKRNWQGAFKMSLIGEFINSAHIYFKNNFEYMTQIWQLSQGFCTAICIFIGNKTVLLDNVKLQTIIWTENG